MRSFVFYWLVAAAGGVLMALEILSSRLLSPHFGNSVYVWGSIIGVFLAALALGYALGGYFADRYPSLAALGRLMVLTGFTLAVLLMTGERLAAFFGRATGGAPAGTLAAAAALFGPTSMLLGMASPWAVRIAGHDLAYLGHTAGRLYALSTAGSLVGTLACTFFFIPFLELRQIFALLLAVTALTGGLALLGRLRRELPAASGAAALLVVAALHLTPAQHFEGALYRRITPYQTLEVVESEGVRYLRGDGVIQGGIRLADGKPALPYAPLMPAALLFDDQIASALLLGLGGGNCATELRKARPAMPIEIVEIDRAVPDVARRFFGFSPGPNERIVIDDARRFLTVSDRRWDFILADTYIGSSVPFHLATREYFNLLRRRLAPGGTLVMNLAGGLELPFSRAIFRTVSQDFPNLYAFRAPGSGNVVVFATVEGPRLRRDELLARAEGLDPGLLLDLPLVQIVRYHWLEVDLDIYSEPLLTDELAPVERLVTMGPDAK